MVSFRLAVGRQASLESLQSNPRTVPPGFLWRAACRTGPSLVEFHKAPCRWLCYDTKSTGQLDHRIRLILVQPSNLTWPNTGLTGPVPPVRDGRKHEPIFLQYWVITECNHIVVSFAFTVLYQLELQRAMPRSHKRPELTANQGGLSPLGKYGGQPIALFSPPTQPQRKCISLH